GLADATRDGRAPPGGRALPRGVRAHRARAADRSAAGAGRHDPRSRPGLRGPARRDRGGRRATHPASQGVPAMQGPALCRALPRALPSDGRGTVVTVGTFDGVHRGHWAVLQEVRARARRGNRRGVLLTFDPHPLRIVRPEVAPRLLTTAVEKKEILAESGLD